MDFTAHNEMIVGTWLSSRAPLLTPSPLRTGLEGFPIEFMFKEKTMRSGNFTRACLAMILLLLLVLVFRPNFEGSTYPVTRL